MTQSTIAIIILAAAIILYSLPFVPMSVTTIFGMLAMAFAGIISFSDAFAGFANSAVLLTAGMMVIGRACFTSGLAKSFGSLLFKFVGSNEKKFVIMVLLVATALAVFLNGALVVALMMPIIDSISSQSGGTITRKQTYFPLGLASTLGNNLTTISATSMITASGIIQAAGYGELNLFAPTIINLPSVLIVIILYAAFGYRLQQRWFNFEEIPVSDNSAAADDAQAPKSKMIITGCVLLAVVVGLVMGVNTGAVALLGSAVVILTGCVGERDAFRSISWSSVIIVAGAMGISKGIDVSGAGIIIAEGIIHVFGDLARSGIGMAVILFIIGSLLSNLMSDNASVAILIPIALSLAETIGCSPIPLALAAASGIKVAVATPISVATMTMVQVPGYRFMDYVKMGGTVNLICIAVSSLVIYFVYFA